MHRALVAKESTQTMKATTLTTAQPLQIRRDFEQWYKGKNGTRLPIYIPSETKKQLVNQFELETKKKYN
jgi:hypothetical protein